jgi:hypothetical protein
MSKIIQPKKSLLKFKSLNSDAKPNIIKPSIIIKE